MSFHPHRVALVAAFALVVGLTGVGGSALADTPTDTPPVLTSLQASTNGDVGLGQSVTETFTTSPGRPQGWRRIIFYDAGGKSHVEDADDTSGTLTFTINKTWAPGPVRIYFAATEDVAYGANDSQDLAAYYGDGHYVSQPITSQTTHDLDLTPALFDVAYPDANATAPVVTGIHASTNDSVPLGQSITETADVTDPGIATTSIEVTDSAGGEHELSSGQPLVLDASWADGPAHVSSVSVHDDSANSAGYSSAGALKTTPATGVTTQSLDFSGGDFTVTSLKLTKETVGPVTGAATVGAVLTVHTGEWDPAPVKLTYQWQWDSDFSDIAGATGPSLVVPSQAWGRPVRVVVTGSRPGYRPVSVASAATSDITAPMTRAPIPVLKGSTKVGGTLTVITGSWAPAPVHVSYQWLANGAVIARATGATFKPTSAQVGKKITLRITGTHAGYVTTVRTSAATKAITKK